MNNQHSTIRLLMEKKAEIPERTFVVSIHRKRHRFLVRKTEIIAGVRVPLYESYALEMESAITLMEQLINEIHGYTLN